MSRLDELIKELCPDGVEYKRLGDVAEVGTGNSNGNEADENGKYPFFIRSQTIKKKNFYEYDDESIIIPGEGGIGDIFHYINGKYALHQRVYRIHFHNLNINTKFIFYYFQCYFKIYILKKAVSATVTSIRKPMIQDFSIPVPPMPIQEEIVKILDKFTSLTAELKAELKARKKQYEYYRDALLSFDEDKEKTEKLNRLIKELCPDGVEYKRLGDVANVTSGNSAPQDKTLFINGIYPFVRTSDVGKIHRTTNLLEVEDYLNDDGIKGLKLFQKGAILFPKSGASTLLNHRAILGQDSYVVSHIAVIIANKINNKFLYYYLTMIDAKTLVEDISYPSLKTSVIADISIPVPPLPIQEEIVRILDRFDTLCDDLSAGLPAEIEKRQKQYEYFRDRLLTFKPKE